MDEYLASYGKILGKKAVTSLRPLHVPSRDPLPDIETIVSSEPRALPVPEARDRGGRRAAQRERFAASSCGEMGTGKTLLAMTAVFKHAQLPRSQGGSSGKFRCLVLCPDHLIAKWKREIEETIPGAKVYHFGTLSQEDAKARKKEDGKTGQRPAINDLINLLDKRDGDRWSKPDGPEYYVIGRDQMKWLPDWLGTTDPYKGFNCVGGLLGGRRVVPQGRPASGRDADHAVASQVQGVGSGEPGARRRSPPATSWSIRSR